MRLKAGKDEIVYLLKRVVEKYESTTGQEIIRNTNRKNYEDLAKVLSEISNELPATAESLDHDNYTPDPNPNKQDYPYRKYDITGGQIKDAYNGIVTNPRPFIVDACYIYLYGVGRKGFDKNPQDPYLIKEATHSESLPVVLSTQEQGITDPRIFQLEQEQKDLRERVKKNSAKERNVWLLILFITIAALGFAITKWMDTKKKWETIKRDMKILPYQPTPAEIDSLEGIWLCYTGSPQARSSDPNRYHMAVSNVVDVKYKNGYFTFERYGANFDHIGYMQFEAPGIISIHSYIKTNTDSIQSPRHSLMQLDKSKPLVSVISASWNFDSGNRNRIIGIREVYVKQGKGGSVEEVINTLDNASCKCKIIRWQQPNQKEKTFYLKNESLDLLPDAVLKSLINENSIILGEPQEGIIISDTANKR